MRRSLLWLMFGGCLSLLSACTLLYEDDAKKQQCKSDADCGRLLGKNNLLTCRSNVCVFADGVTSLDGDAGKDDGKVDASVDSGVKPRVPCKNAKDCGEGERCGFDGFCYEKWGCLDDDADWLDNVKQDFSYTATIRSLQSPDDASLLGKLSASACSAADPTCQRPKVDEKAVTVTEDKVLTLPFTGVGSSGFVGFIKMVAEQPDQGADAGTEARAVLPGYFHFTAENPLVNDVVTQDRSLLIDTGTYGLLATVAGIGSDEGSGTIVFLIYDCGGQSAADISVTPSGVSDFTFLPIQGETSPVTGGTATTEDGVGIVINVPPGSQSFVIKDETQNRIVSDTISFNVRPEAINYVQYYPRYSGLKAWMDEHARREAAR